MSKRGFAPIFIIVIVAIVLALGGGALYYAKKFSAPQPTAPQLVVTNTTSTQDVTAGWKTYRNEKYGFEFAYPQNWEVETVKSKYVSSDETVFLKLGTQKATCFDKNPPSDCVFLISVDPSSNGDLSYWERNSSAKEGLIVGGKSARRFIIQTNEFIIIPLGGKPILLLEYDGRVRTSSNTEIFNNLVSTFKFLK